MASGLIARQDYRPPLRMSRKDVREKVALVCNLHLALTLGHFSRPIHELRRFRQNLAGCTDVVAATRLCDQSSRGLPTHYFQ